MACRGFCSGPGGTPGDLFGIGREVAPGLSLPSCARRPPRGVRSASKLATPPRGGSSLGTSLVYTAHDDGDGCNGRWAHGWQGGARVVPECDRFVIHADRATFGFMITFRVVRLWLWWVVFGGPPSRSRCHRGPSWPEHPGVAKLLAERWRGGRGVTCVDFRCPNFG